MVNSNESATARLSRLLTMVPWLVNRQGIDLAEAARSLGVSDDQIESDLMLLFLCGTPGHLPDDLIEAEWDSGHVYLRNAETIERPLRLNRDEALALIVGLRTLQAVPGLGERDAVERALTKLTEAVGEVAGADQVQVVLDDAAPQHVLTTVRAALQNRRRLHLRYLVASRDESTERDVDPMRLLSIDGHWYLEGWCHRADDQRIFRLDRIEAIAVLDLDGTPPAQARPRELDGSVFQAGPKDTRVRLRLQPAAAWVAEYYPVQSVDALAGGILDVTLAVGDLSWAAALVLRLGDSGRVLSPPELRERVLASAQEALTAYPQSSS